MDKATEIIVKACYARNLALARNFAECIPIAFPTEKLAAFVFEGKPDKDKCESLEKDGWTVINFDAAEVEDGKKEAEVIIDYLGDLAIAADDSEPEVVAAPVPTVIREEADFTNEDLGIEPETVETPVRRASYNRGLRFRRAYGPQKIPVAFVSCKIAVYVTDGEVEDQYDEELKEAGWTIIRFDGADVTDGEKEADIIEKAVKDATRAMKAAAAKAKRAKARKAAKKSA